MGGCFRGSTGPREEAVGHGPLTTPDVAGCNGKSVDAPAGSNAGEEQSAIYESEAEAIQCEVEAEVVHDCSQFGGVYDPEHEKAEERKSIVGEKGG